MTYDYGQLNEKEISKRIGIVAHKAYFDKVKDTSSFDLIMLAISNFEMQAPASAYYALQGMKTRFAAQELQLDLASIVNLTTYFEDISGVIIDFEDNMQLTMCEEYMKMKVKYPEMEKPFFKRLKERRSRGVYGNPYLILASKYEWKMGGEKFKSSKWKKLREKASEYHYAYGALEKTF